MYAFFLSLKELFSGKILPSFTQVIKLSIIFFVGVLVGKLVSKIIYRLLSEIELNTLVKKAIHRKVPLVYIISNIVKYLIYFSTFILLLNRLGITSTFFEIFGGAILFLLFVGLLISFKDFFPNFFASFGICKVIHVNDIIEYKKVRGKVVQLKIVYVVVENAQHDLIYVPYTELKRELFQVVKQ